MEQLGCENISSFITLTYAPENIPDGDSLSPRDMALFLKRLRHDRRYGFGSIRYFYVGEYGERTQRPHYHLALWDIPPERAEPSVRKLWSVNGAPIGHIHVGEITPKSIAYIAGYCLKKMGKNDIRLAGRYPEYGRRSKYPPLGSNFFHRRLLPALTSSKGLAAIAKNGYLPATFRYDGRQLPLPDYWRQKAAEETGYQVGAGSPDWSFDIEILEEFENAQKKATEKLLKNERKHNKTFSNSRPL